MKVSELTQNRLQTIVDGFKANPKTWAKDAVARNKYGHHVQAISPSAVKWCIYGRWLAMGFPEHEFPSDYGVYSVYTLNDTAKSPEHLERLLDQEGFLPPHPTTLVDADDDDDDHGCGC